MRATTLPRTLAVLQYKVASYPAQLLEVRVLAPFLADESPLRLAYERALGTLDATAGSLLGDDGLRDRGRALRERAQRVDKVAVLEAKADERREEATTTLRQRQQELAAQKAQAQREHEQQAARLQAQREAKQTALAQESQARKRAEERRIQSETQAEVAAERARVEAQKATIEARVARSTQPQQQELRKAGQGAKAAKQKAADADTLAALTAAEKASR